MKLRDGVVGQTQDCQKNLDSPPGSALPSRASPAKSPSRRGSRCTTGGRGCVWRSITECCVQLKEGDGLPPIYETQCLHRTVSPPRNGIILVSTRCSTGIFVNEQINSMVFICAVPQHHDPAQLRGPSSQHRHRIKPQTAHAKRDAEAGGGGSMATPPASLASS